MSEPRIEITLSMEAEQAQETIREFAQQSAESLNRTFATATERAAAKVNDLAESQKRLGAVIVENTTRMDQLRQSADRASTGEKQKIEQEIVSLGKLNQAHFAELRLLDEKRLKLEAKGAAAAASSDAEKLAIQLVTQNRLIEMQTLRDTVRAQQQVKDTAAASAAQQQAALDQIDRRYREVLGVITQHQQRLGAVAASQQAAGTNADAALASEAEGLERAIASRQTELIELDAKKAKITEAAELLNATTQQEQDAIRSVTDQKLQGLAVERDQARIRENTRKSQTAENASAVQETSKRSAAIDVLNRKEVEYRSIIDQESRQLDTINAKRDAASGQDKKNLAQQSEALRKIIEAHRQEVFEIERKRIALEEEQALATATTDKEREGIRSTTEQRLIEIGVIRDQSKAQSSVTQSIRESDNAAASLFRQFAGAVGISTGVGAIVQVFRALSQSIENTRQQVERLVAAGESIRSRNESQYERVKPFLDEYGIGEEEGTKTINAIADNVLPQSVVASTAAGLSPILKRMGIDYKSDRFKSLVGQASIFADRGISSDNLRDFTQQFLAQNPNASGTDLNSGLSGVVAATGSPSMANSFLSTYAQTKGIADEAKMDFTDVEKLYVQLSKNKNLSPQEVPELVRQYMASSGRLRGLTPTELEGQIMALGEASGQHPHIQRAMDVYRQALASGKDIDITAFQSMLATLSPDEQAIVMRSFGGPRGLAAQLAGTGYRGVNLPKGGTTGPRTDQDALAKVAKEQADAKAAQQEPTEAAAAGFAEAMKTEEAHLDRNPVFIAQEFQPFSTDNLTHGGRFFFGTGPEYVKNQAAANVYTRKLIEMARLMQKINNGEVMATPAQKQRLQQAMYDLNQFSGLNAPEAMDALVNGTAGSSTRAGVLSDYDKAIQSGPQGEDRFFAGVLGDHYYGVDNHVIDDKAAGRTFSEADKIQRELSAQRRPATQLAGPTSRPTTPVSVNYHQRIVNYGYGADAVGAPESVANNFG